MLRARESQSQGESFIRGTLFPLRGKTQNKHFVSEGKSFFFGGFSSLFMGWGAGWGGERTKYCPEITLTIVL